MKRIAVLLMDARPAARRVLRAVLETERDIVVAGEADNPDQAKRAAIEHQPDVVVVGVGAPLAGGLAAARKILKGAPSARVLLLVSHGTAAIRASADNPWEAFRLLIEQAANLPAVSPPRQPSARAVRWRPSALPRARRASKQKPPGRLTLREGQVLRSIANGFSNKQIAGELGLSIKTVEKHRQQMMDKLNIHGIAGLTRYAILQGMLALG